MSGEVKLTTRNALRVLRNGPFRRYIIGSAISDTGTWMQVMAQAWVMTTLTSSALMLGLVNLCSGVPMLALTMVGGSAADRFDKRKILLITQYVQIAIAVSIGMLIWTGHIAIWQVFIFAAILGASNSFEMPTLSALVPELVGREQIQPAVSLDRSVFHGSRMVGFSLAGLAIKAWGMASAFFFNAVSFVALIIAILSLPPRRKGTAEEEEKRASGIKEGFRYIAKDAPSLAMIMLIATQSLCIFPIITVMMPLYGRLVLNLGADQVGLLMGASAVGSVVGSLFLIGLPRDKRVPLMMMNAVAVTGAIFGLSRAPSFYIATALMIVNSLGLATNFGLCSTIVQERAPEYLRGRVSAVFMLSFVGIMPIAGLGVTGLSDLIGMPSALLVASLTYGTITLLILARVRRQCCEPAVSESRPAQTPPVAATV
ncbi:MAG TPA: MFS transporter [Chthoniobacterales bacterium]|nr:MFS transporter [Chthoniobacterales bacterium]